MFKGLNFLNVIMDNIDPAGIYWTNAEKYRPSTKAMQKINSSDITQAGQCGMYNFLEIDNVCTMT